MWCLQETHFGFKNTHKLKVKGGQNIFSAYESQKREEVAVLFSKIKIQFKSKPVIRDKYHYILIKGSIHQRMIHYKKYINTQHWSI